MVQLEGVEPWLELAERLRRRCRIDDWSVSEPVLRGASPTDLQVLTAAGADRDLADKVLGALVRLAALDGGNDLDAASVLVHLLAPGVNRICREIRGLSPEPRTFVVGELMCRIRSFPWRRRTRAFAANLLRDCRRGVMHDLLGGDPPDRARWTVRPVDPDRLTMWADRSEYETAADVDLADLLRWAADNGIAERDDLKLLVDIHRAKDCGFGRVAVAASWGINERTLRRRRDRALTALRAATPRYFAAVA